MRISVIGTGYVGLGTALGFAAHGHASACVDVDESKISGLNNGVPPFAEEGVEAALKDALSKNLVTATADCGSAVVNSGITFICVGTPSLPDGSIDLSYVTAAAESVGKALESKGSYHVVCVKSTVLPGTTEKLIKILENASGKAVGRDFGVAMNPEFLREGFMLRDFLNPDRIVIGELDAKSGDAVESLYSGFNAPVLRTRLRTAEMIKYASNAFLATKVTFVNELGNLCKKLGIDVYDVARGMGYDKRISPHFLEAGCGFGGSCFPKDVAALSAVFREHGINAGIVSAVMKTNEEQKRRMVDMLLSRIDPNGKKIAVLGLAFKKGTDDVRDSVAIDVLRELKRAGAEVHAYDPVASGNMKKIFPDISYSESANRALEGAHACLVLTDWNEFSGLSDSDFSSMKNKIIIEGRRVLDRSRVSSFEGVCW